MSVRSGGKRDQREKRKEKRKKKRKRKVLSDAYAAREKKGRASLRPRPTPRGVRTHRHSREQHKSRINREKHRNKILVEKGGLKQALTQNTNKPRPPLHLFTVGTLFVVPSPLPYSPRQLLLILT